MNAIYEIYLVGLGINKSNIFVGKFDRSNVDLLGKMINNKLDNIPIREDPQTQYETIKCEIIIKRSRML